MQTRFVPCRGKEFCTDDANRCKGCGRTLAEVDRTRTLADELAAFALEMDYLNEEEFIDYVARKALKKVRYRRENPQ